MTLKPTVKIKRKNTIVRIVDPSQLPKNLELDCLVQPGTNGDATKTDSGKNRDFVVKLARSLKHLRETRGWSMSEASARLGTVKSTYQHWETGRSQPALHQLPKIASLYGISMDKLLGIKPMHEGDHLKALLDQLPKRMRCRFIDLLELLAEDVTSKKK